VSSDASKPDATGTPGTARPTGKIAPPVDIFVEEHEALPEGCELRFARVGLPRPVSHLRYEPLEGPGGVFRVEGRDAGDVVVRAHAVEVDDSSAGTSTLVYGGSWGLRLLRDGDDLAPPLAEPYLLLAASEILD